MKRIVTPILLAAFFACLVMSALMTATEDAEAIPAFARKYKMSCTTCHAPIPRLKDYGEEFAGNGFVLEDKDAPRYFVDTGDEDLDLIRDVPLAMRLEGFIKHHTETDRDVDFTMPYNLKLLTGGSLTRNVSYYFYFFFSERGEVVGIEDAYVHFNNLFNSDLDIMVGQFQVSDPLFKREVRLTYEDYQVYKRRVGDCGINLAYDRGLMITYGFETGTDIVVEVLNGNGIGAADDNRVYDTDKYKNFAGRISQGLGENLRVGGFGYYGKEGDHNPDEVWMLGGDATVSYLDKLQINMQYLERRDDNPFFENTVPTEKYETQGGLAELVYMPHGERSKWYGVVLYNFWDSQIGGDDYESISFQLGHVFRTNIRFLLENTYEFETEENRLVLGLVAGI